MRALMIERDGGQGDARPGRAEKPAKLKRVYLIDLAQLHADGVVETIDYVDRLGIKDPNEVTQA